MTGTGGYEGITLGSVFGDLGQAVDQHIALNERKAERDAAERQAAEKARLQREQQNTAANLRNLNDNTDASKMVLGDKYYDTVTQQALKQTYDELISKVGSTDPVSFDYLLHQQLNDVNKFHQEFKNDFEYTKKGVEEQTKGNDNIDVNATKEVALSQLHDKYFKRDESGSWVRKSADEVNTNTNPLAILQDPRMQGNLAIGDIGVIKDKVQKMALHNLKDSDYVGNKGYVHASGYDIKRSDLQDVTFDENGKPELKFKTENIHLGNGLNLRMLPEDTWKEFNGDPATKSAIEKLWNPMRAVLQEKLNKNGEDLTPKVEEMVKRDFIRNAIETGNWDMSFINEKEKQVVPRPQTNINIYPNGAQSAATGSEFDRIGNIEGLVGKHSGVTIKNGSVVDKNGDAYEGEIVVPTNQLPSGLKAIIKPVLNQIDAVADFYNVKIVDGKIEAIKPSGGSWIDRQDLRNLQLQNNAEPLKAPQKIYGKPEDNKSSTQSKKKKYNPATGQFE